MYHICRCCANFALFQGSLSQVVAMVSRAILVCNRSREKKHIRILSSSYSTAWLHGLILTPSSCITLHYAVPSLCLRLQDCLNMVRWDACLVSMAFHFVVELRIRIKQINKTHDWNQDLYSICAPQEKINLGQTEEKSTHKLCHYQPPQEVMSELQIRFGLEFLAVEFGSLLDRKKGLYSDHITSEKYYVQDDSSNISTQFPPFHQDTINSTKLSTSLWSMSISKVELWLSQLPWSFWSIGGTWRSQIIWPLSWRLNTWRHSKWMSR